MAKTPSHELVNWEEQLAKAAQIQGAAVKELTTGGAKYISIRAGQLSYGGEAIAGNKMSVVVLNSVFEHAYYASDYDPDKLEIPVCFAFGQSIKEMAPHDKSEQKQHSACSTCPQNKFGSSDKGKGKACKNIMRLALITSEGLDDIEHAEIAYLKLPVMSVKNFAKYTDELVNSFKRPTWSVLTEISVVPDKKSQYRVVFKMLDKVDDGDALEVLSKRSTAAYVDLAVPYVRKEDSEPEVKKPKVKKKFQ